MFDLNANVSSADLFARTRSLAAKWLVVIAFGAASILGMGVDPSRADLLQTKKLLPYDPGEQASFGSSVAIDGDRAVVGAYHADLVPHDEAGAAYIFERDNGGSGNWGQVRKLFANDFAYGNDFGTSVAISGDTIAVGAPDADSEDGAVYIFQRDQGGTGYWGQVRKITASDGENDDAFGKSVAIDGDIIVVGAPYDNDTQDMSGSAYVFHRNQGGTNNWGQVKKLHASDPGYFGTFGTSIGISGDTVIIGAPLHSAPAHGSGAAYIFRRDEGGVDNWGEEDRLVASNATLNANFGYVAISETTALIGAPYARLAYIFERDGGGDWNEQKIIQPIGGISSSQFGFHVSIDGDNAVVGAYVDSVPGASYAGSAYLFSRDEGGIDNWGQINRFYANDPATSDHFGTSLAISGTTCVVGAYGNDDSYSDAGSAYVFENLVLGDIDGSGTVDLADTILTLQILTGITPSQAVSAVVEINGDDNLGIAEALFGLQTVAEME